MASPYPERQKEVFGQALELPSEDREAFVKQECGEDLLLFAAVMEMLRKHARLPPFFEEGAPFLKDVIPATPPGRQAEFRGNSRFQVVRELGSGGFGTVFEAFDRREKITLALKLLNRPEATELRMFKREFRT